jgi:sialate O-acetylesterase
VFHSAEATLSERRQRRHVTVSSPAVPTPVAVRYAWDNCPTANLANTEGLPAAPFRTDDWPREGAN